MYTAVVMLATVAAQPAEAKPTLPAFAEEAIKPALTDSPLRKLQKDRVRERVEAVKRFQAALEVGRWDARTFGEYVELQSTLGSNLSDLFDKPEEKVKCYEMRLEAMMEFEKYIEANVKAGNLRSQDSNPARAARIDAEIDLLKFKETFAVELPNDADGLLKQSIADINALAAALDNKEPIDKIRAKAQKLKTTTEKLNTLNLSKESRAVLDAKYKTQLQEATTRLLSAAVANPESFKLVEEALRK